MHCCVPHGARISPSPPTAWSVQNRRSCFSCFQTSSHFPLLSAKLSSSKCCLVKGQQSRTATSASWFAAGQMRHRSWEALRGSQIATKATYPALGQNNDQLPRRRSHLLQHVKLDESLWKQFFGSWTDLEHRVLALTPQKQLFASWPGFERSVLAVRHRTQPVERGPGLACPVLAAHGKQE